MKVECMHIQMNYLFLAKVFVMLTELNPLPLSSLYFSSFQKNIQELKFYRTLINQTLEPFFTIYDSECLQKVIC